MKKVTVAAAIIRQENKILCMQRGKDRHDYTSFKWEFPGGKIEEGESNEQALQRELIEEMNMDVIVKEHYCDVVHTYPNFMLTMHVYNCEAKDKNFVMNVHNDYKWLEVNELKSLDWAAADMPVVEKLMSEMN